MFGFIYFIIYFCYLLFNSSSSISLLLRNQITDSEIINTIQNILNDNTFNDSIITYECFHYLKLSEKVNKNYKITGERNAPKRVITKTGSMNYSYKSMRDISGKINLKTLGYSNMRVYISINVEMDEETKIDFEEITEGFLADYKYCDQRFNSIINHNYEKNRASKQYIVKVNGGKCTFIYNKYIYWIIIILGHGEIIKFLIRNFLNKGIQMINIKKIISSKNDLRETKEIQKHGYDKLIPVLCVNDKIYENNNNIGLEIINSDEKLDINENLLNK